MNHPVEQNQEKGLYYTSALIRLFEQKGYTCEELSIDNDTVYVMKSNFSQKENVLAPKPKITVN